MASRLAVVISVVGIGLFVMFLGYQIVRTRAITPPSSPKTSARYVSTADWDAVSQKTLRLSAALAIKIPSSYSPSLASYDNWEIADGKMWALRASPERSAWGSSYPEIQIFDFPFTQEQFCEVACGGRYSTTENTCNYLRRFGYDYLPLSEPVKQGGYALCRWEDFKETSAQEAAPFYRTIGVADFKLQRLYIINWTFGYGDNGSLEPIAPELLIAN